MKFAKKNKNDPKKTPEEAASKSETNLKDSSNKNKEKIKTYNVSPIIAGMHCIN